jgi:outer membrane protein
MRKLGIWILGVGIIVMMGGSGAIAAESIKIGYVDMQKALNLSEAGKLAKKMITQVVAKIDKQLAGQKKELEKIREDLEKRGMVMSETMRKEKEREYQTKLRDLQRMQRDFEDEIRRKDREYTGQILKDLADIVRKIGEERKYSLILENNQPAVIYIPSGFDLTEEVIQLYNQQQKGPAKKP